MDTQSVVHPKDLDIRERVNRESVAPRKSQIHNFNTTTGRYLTCRENNHPHYRKVLQSDVVDLKLHRLFFDDKSRAIVESSPACTTKTPAARMTHHRVNRYRDNFSSVDVES